jgi:peptidoglycan/xylan/chitin deacetylase (PgdA/CDA1 family)
MLWKRGKTQLKLEDIDPSVDGIYEFGKVHGATHVLLERNIAQLGPGLQARALQQLAERLDLEEAALVADKRFRLIALEDIHKLAALGVDTQLHTHDHFMPKEFAGLREQLEKNAQYIRRYRHGEPPRHFCYPSGQHSDEHRVWLAQLDIASATTCDPGMNRRGQNPYLLRRFLDSDSISDIEFEAYICGFFEIGRLVRASISRHFGR